MTRKSAPKSLFVWTRDIKDIRDISKYLKEGIPHAPQRQYDEDLKIMLDAAADAEVDQNIEEGQRYADSIRTFSALLDHFVSQDDTLMSVLWMARLTQAWMMLRMDAVAARPVRSEQRRTAPLRKGKKKPPPDVIARAIASSPSVAAAAKKLGCSKRSVQRWKKQEKLR